MPENKKTPPEARAERPQGAGGVRTPAGTVDIEGSQSTAHGCVAVVGIGASAGGLEAFTRFFAAMPPDSDMAFVLIQHLDPNHRSLAAELLGKHTAMPVVEAAHQMPVEPNRIYVIPANAYLTINDGRLHLGERRGLRLPIDTFFRSLAQDRHERAVGIILSGSGADGSLGLREIKAAGGMIIVQTPETTAFHGMAQSAMATGMVDYVMPIEDMPQVLASYVSHWYVNGAAPAEFVTKKAADNLRAVIAILRAQVKCDFSCYKKGTISRRVQRRMGLTRTQTMSEYVELLRCDEEEVKALHKDLLIGVTNFFRDPDAWEALSSQAIATLIREYDDHRPIRVWIPGCATGEEAYSLAMVLCEELQRAHKTCAYQIFASDIDLDALAFARAGIYPASIAADVSPERLRRFFSRGEHTYQISKDLRESMVFATQNLVSDPPFSNLDLVSCRNLLIYLEAEAQKKVMSLFNFALRDGGYLFLGGSETANQRSDLFQAVSRKHRIYRGFNRPAPVKIDLPSVGTRHPALIQTQITTPERRPYRLTAVAQQVVAQLVARRFGPAYVLINHATEVLYLNGPVDRYLQLPGGELGADLATMARPGLRAPLRKLLREAFQTDRAAMLDDVRMKKDGVHLGVRVCVEPLRYLAEVEDLYLVVFEGANTDHQSRLAEIAPLEPPRGEAEGAVDYEAILHQLEEELASTREDLRSTVEELHTANEEFRASNEEITSINEELRSTNEELETSKEELQSLNEELFTANNQLEQKIIEVEATNNDLNNLLTSTDMATLFLDRSFCLKRFTAACGRLIHLSDTDIGRPISDFALNFNDPELLPDAKRVLDQLTAVEREIRGGDGRYYLRRVLPYRTEDDRIIGVVITFSDISAVKEHEQALVSIAAALDVRVHARTAELKAASMALRESEEWLRLAVHGSEMGSWDLDLKTGTGRWSKNYLEIMGHEAIPDKWSAMEVWRSRIHPRDRKRVADGLEQARRERSLFVSEHRIQRGAAGEPRWVSARGRFFYNADKAVRFVGVVKDITERKDLERRAARLAEEERQRLGRELHDALGQEISAMGMLATALANVVSAGTPGAEQAGRLESIAEQAKMRLARLTRGLLPISVEARNLRAALKDLAREATETYQIPCRLEVEGRPRVSNDFAATQLYHIASEATHNAAKHARTPDILIRLEHSRDGVHVSVRDQGIGIPPEAIRARGLGLDIMRHRCASAGGVLHIESLPEGGTRVRCVIPKDN